VGAATQFFFKKKLFKFQEKTLGGFSMLFPHTCKKKTIGWPPESKSFFLGAFKERHLVVTQCIFSHIQEEDHLVAT